MRLKAVLGCGAAMAMLAVGTPGNAVVINLVDQGFAGTAAQQAQFRAGFSIAASYWSSILTNNATINLGVGTASLASGIIGSTGSARADYSVANWETRINATKSGSPIDSTLVLPALTSSGGASFITNGTTPTTIGGIQDDLSKLAFDPGTTASSQTLYLNSSVIKAIGGTAGGVTANSIDGTVRFSTNFNFDFNPTDGVSANTFDFIGVAIHEIGHALGFVSGVDFLDVYGVNGGGNSPNAGALSYSLNDTSIYSALDMFRYSKDPTNLVLGDAPVLDLSVSGDKYFSIDGGKTALFGNYFSNGRYNGTDRQQASHWRDTAGCLTGNGIMDPTFCFGQMGEVTGLDLAAYDAMGWNLSVNALTYGTTSTSTIYRQFATAVPEPMTWGMMILGFGLVGGMMRRRSTKVAFAI